MLRLFPFSKVWGQRIEEPDITPPTEQQVSTVVSIEDEEVSEDPGGVLKDVLEFDPVDVIEDLREKAKPFPTLPVSKEQLLKVLYPYNPELDEEEAELQQQQQQQLAEAAEEAESEEDKEAKSAWDYVQRWVWSFLQESEYDDEEEPSEEDDYPWLDLPEEDDDLAIDHELFDEDFEWGINFTLFRVSPVFGHGSPWEDQISVEHEIDLTEEGLEWSIAFETEEGETVWESKGGMGVEMGGLITAFDCFDGVVTIGWGAGADVYPRTGGAGWSISYESDSTMWDFAGGPPIFELELVQRIAPNIVMTLDYAGSFDEDEQADLFGSFLIQNPDDGWYFTWDSDLDEFQLNYWSTLKVGAEAEDEIEWEVQLDLEWDEKLRAWDIDTAVQITYDLFNLVYHTDGYIQSGMDIDLDWLLDEFSEDEWTINLAWQLSLTDGEIVWSLGIDVEEHEDWEDSEVINDLDYLTEEPEEYDDEVDETDSEYQMPDGEDMALSSYQDVSNFRV